MKMKHDQMDVLLRFIEEVHHHPNHPFDVILETTRTYTPYKFRVSKKTMFAMKDHYQVANELSRLQEEISLRNLKVESK